MDVEGQDEDEVGRGGRGGKGRKRRGGEEEEEWGGGSTYPELYTAVAVLVLYTT